MGWCSWYQYDVHISDTAIRKQAAAMKSSGLLAAGYNYINIDDGYFEGRAPGGQLMEDRAKFPLGMKATVDFIHSLGMKAGIYSDGGCNTCGSIWNNDKKGIGVGLYGHVLQDATLFFKNWGFDYIKVDWCGGKVLKLDEKTTYLNIIDTMRMVKPDVVFNLCRWQFPGIWAIKAADSWRMSADIHNNFKEIQHIIDLNANLWQYVSPGHYNDMDMLQVGRGLTDEEDKTHFSMWCMLTSPLMISCDVANISAASKEILTNQELIAIDQDPGFRQAKRLIHQDLGCVDVFVKPLGKKSKQWAIAIMNRSDSAVRYHLEPNLIGLKGDEKLRDLWRHQDMGRLDKLGTITLPAHGIQVFRTLE
ncbi:Alpha galactosidase A [Arachidicoccus rhizosphaerae]|uniref:Alpha-galactosidase n=1 Tax=Arachidicoccus rhizosphaerae TaxID=551991 RepID=A0A1H3XE33_9BACT|nr:glycoside hydrolase family 27 protein [Arachidicoccus rhizosphaerae]SDZ97593.1 Alpha galactosidase A [Arachidicoccus rhizosphaerae]